MSFRFSQILTVWFQKVLTTVVLLLQGNSDNLTVLWIHKICHCFGSVLLSLSRGSELCCPLGGPLYVLYCSNEPQCWGQSKTLMWAKTASRCFDVRHQDLTELYNGFETCLLDRIKLRDSFAFLCLVVSIEILNIPALGECVVEWWCILKLMRSGRKDVTWRKMFLHRHSLIAVWLTFNPLLSCLNVMLSHEKDSLCIL